MTRKTKTKTKNATKTPTLHTLIEQTDTLLATGLSCLDRYVRGVVARPMYSKPAEQLADLCVELVRLRGALAESERAARPAAT